MNDLIRFLYIVGNEAEIGEWGVKVAMRKPKRRRILALFKFLVFYYF